jgi:hypothetical protein
LDRLLVTVLVWALLVATAAAFVVTEALKLERPPIGAIRGNRFLSPVCSCPKETTRLSFRLRKAGAIDVAIVDAEGDPVRVLASGARPGRGRVAFRWGGRNDAGAIVPDGAYRLRVRLVSEDRTVTFRRGVVVDTEPPTVRLLEVDPRRTAPGGEGVRLRLELHERARVFLLVDGRRAARLGTIDSGTAEVVWRGTSRGRALPSGEYRISLRARDRAGNRSRPTLPVQISVVRAG